MVSIATVTAIGADLMAISTSKVSNLPLRLVANQVQCVNGLALIAQTEFAAWAPAVPTLLVSVSSHAREYRAV